MRSAMKRFLASFAIGAVFLASAPALAQHSYAMFDMTKTITLNGSVVQFKWQNPHSFIRLDVPVNGQVEHWAIEMTSPNNLAVEGWFCLLLLFGVFVCVLFLLLFFGV